MGILGLRRVERTEKVVYVDSFKKDEESYDVNIPPRYKHHRLTISINFHQDRQCRVNDCKAIRISAHGVTDIPLAHVNGKPGVRLQATGIVGGETFRVTWKLKPIRSVAREG